MKMDGLHGSPKMTYKEALLSKEARNCGIYIIYEEDTPVYIGKVSGQTLKRRLAEHTSKDNQFNGLAKKVARLRKIPLDELDSAIDYIEENYSVVLLPMPMHLYNSGNYFFDKEQKRADINAKERELINEYKPSLNKR